MGFRGLVLWERQSKDKLDPGKPAMFILPGTVQGSCFLLWDPFSMARSPMETLLQRGLGCRAGIYLLGSYGDFQQVPASGFPKKGHCISPKGSKDPDCRASGPKYYNPIKGCCT